MRDALDQIMEIDKQVTTLERVTGGMEGLNTVMDSGVDIATRLGNTISEINEGLVSFSRQGFRGEDLSAITEYATIFSNVSDMGIEDSASALTAGMKAFNIEAEDSIRIVDSMNEVDNNYSITSENLAKSMQKSAGASQAYGVSLEKNIGYATAIGQVSRESGDVIGEVVAEFKSFLIDLEPLTIRLRAIRAKFKYTLNDLAKGLVTS